MHIPKNLRMALSALQHLRRVSASESVVLVVDCTSIAPGCWSDIIYRGDTKKSSDAKRGPNLTHPHTQLWCSLITPPHHKMSRSEEPKIHENTFFSRISTNPAWLENISGFVELFSYLKERWRAILWSVSSCWVASLGHYTLRARPKREFGSGWSKVMHSPQ